MGFSNTPEEKLFMYTWVKNYINDHCIVRRPTGDNDFVLQSTDGGQYNWQFYLRRGLLEYNFLKFTSMLFWNKFKPVFDQTPFQIAGLETGSTPLIVGLMMMAPMFDVDTKAFSIRKNRKTYGMLNRIEGIPNDYPVMLVDDLSNSKNTMMHAKNYVEEYGLNIFPTAFTVVNKNELMTDSLNHDKHIGKSINVESLFTLEDFDLYWDDYHSSPKFIGLQ